LWLFHRVFCITTSTLTFVCFYIINLCIWVTQSLINLYTINKYIFILFTFLCGSIIRISLPTYYFLNTHLWVFRINNLIWVSTIASIITSIILLYFNITYSQKNTLWTILWIDGILWVAIACITCCVVSFI
jgi:hypothetical protein